MRSAEAGTIRCPVRLPALACAAALAVAAPFAWADDTHAGTLASYALPLATLGATFVVGDRDGAWQFGKATVVTLAGTEVLKRTTHVERPDSSDDQSFPSGHAARAFAASTFVHRRYGLAYAAPLYAVSLWIGATRVNADKHRWGDVAGAAALAAASTWWLVDPRPRGASIGAWRDATGWHAALQMPL
jgi:membrane-associated phospholipid phosphatase